MVIARMIMRTRGRGIMSGLSGLGSVWSMLSWKWNRVPLCSGQAGRCTPLARSGLASKFLGTPYENVAMLSL